MLDGKKISLEFYRVVDINFGNFVFQDKLLCYNDESSPKDGEDPCKLHVKVCHVNLLMLVASNIPTLHCKSRSYKGAERSIHNRYEFQRGAVLYNPL